MQISVSCFPGSRAGEEGCGCLERSSIAGVERAIKRWRRNYRGVGTPGRGGRDPRQKCIPRENKRSSRESLADARPAKTDNNKLVIARGGARREAGDYTLRFQEPPNLLRRLRGADGLLFFPLRSIVPARFEPRRSHVSRQTIDSPRRDKINCVATY